MDPEVRALIEQLAGSVAREFARINQRFDAVDRQLVELRLEFGEKYESLGNRLDQFERRMHADIAGVRHDIALLFAREDGPSSKSDQ